MKFTPAPKDENRDLAVFRPGKYAAVVHTAEETTSKAGNECFKIGLKVYNGAETTYVWEYLLPEGAAAWKLRAFCEAVGLGEQYESGELEAADMLDLNLTVRLDVEPARDGYDAKNRVKSFLPSDGSAKPAGSGDDSDEAPF